MSKKNIKFKILLDDLKNNKTESNKYFIIHKILSVLDDKRGWRKFGYTFEYIQKNTSDKDIDLIITVKPNADIRRICGFDGLSCASYGNQRLKFIYINLENWLNGSDKSKLSLDLYRTYVINHEMGHILGRHHLKSEDQKPGSLAPIRIQQTLGIGHCSPNPYPLDWEDF